MFDIGWDEMLFTAIIAIVVIGPKDLPRALRTAGQWIGKIRRVSGHFRSGIETMIREAEMEDMEKNWREQNEAIMAAHPPEAAADAALVGTNPGTLMTPLPAPVEPVPVSKQPRAKKQSASKSAAKPRATTKPRATAKPRAKAK
jgi:sec-independent protein translocase protein TatB